jgi:hypothetical protein
MFMAWLESQQHSLPAILASANVLPTLDGGAGSVRHRFLKRVPNWH